MIRSMVVVVLLVLLGAWLYFAENEGECYQIIDGECFGTYYHIKIRTPEHDAELGELIDRELAQVSKQMSIHDENSELTAINHARAKEWVAVSPEMNRVLRQAQDIYTMSGGRFDPTISSVLELWGFGKNKEKRVPSRHLIEEKLRLVGFSKIKLHDDGLKLMKESDKLAMNLSAIAKGYGVDRVAALLKRRGYQHFIVEIGGEISASGERLEGAQGWNVAVEHPEGIADEHHAKLVIQLQDKSIATSGNYRQFFTDKGQRYAHTIDPLTGYPVNNGIISVSVLSSSAMRADALATAIMAMPREQALQLIDQHQLAVILLQQKDDNITYHLSAYAQKHLVK